MKKAFSGLVSLFGLGIFVYFILVGIGFISPTKNALENWVEEVVTEMPSTKAECIKESVIGRYSLWYRFKRGVLPGKYKKNEGERFQQWLYEANSICKKLNPLS